MFQQKQNFLFQLTYLQLRQDLQHPAITAPEDLLDGNVVEQRQHGHGADQPHARGQRGDVGQQDGGCRGEERRGVPENRNFLPALPAASDELRGGRPLLKEERPRLD